MKKYKYIGLILVFAISITACEKDSNIDVPIVTPELVTTCYLSPNNDMNDLILSWSAPIFNTTNHDMPFEENADVYISDGSNKVKMHYESGIKKYLISKTELAIIAGKKYTLSVKSNKSKDLYAETIIPVKPIFSISYQGMDSIRKDGYSGDYYSYRFYVNINIKNPDKTAYYRINLMGLLEQFGSKYITELHSAGDENIIIHGDYNDLLIIERQMSPGAEKLLKIFVNVLKVDESYYRFHHALENYRDADIFSEPTLVYSNVENGLGVFCSYNNRMDSVAVK